MTKDYFSKSITGFLFLYTLQYHYAGMQRARENTWNKAGSRFTSQTGFWPVNHLAIELFILTYFLVAKMT
jgi:hypothetical protein